MAKFNLSAAEKAALFGDILPDEPTQPNKEPSTGFSLLTNESSSVIKSLAMRVDNYEKHVSALNDEVASVKLEQRNVETRVAVKLDEIPSLIKKQLGELAHQQHNVIISNPVSGANTTRHNVHPNYPELVKLASLRIPTLMVGPAGSGKTTAAQHVAEDLNLEFHPISIGPATLESKLLGYVDANSNYVSTPLRKAYEHGGVFLCDEVDAGNPAALLVLNAALANNKVGFPDGTITKHPDFIAIAGANTWGYGGNSTYTRNALDGAFRDRFLKLEWNYDENVERAMCPDSTWLEMVKIARGVVTRLKSTAIISPRASANGYAMINAGFSYARTLEITILNGLDSATKAEIKTAIQQNS